VGRGPLRELELEGRLRAGVLDVTVTALLVAAGRLWGGLGNDVVMWGAARARAAGAGGRKVRPAQPSPSF
jgi:hypothetical protein